MSDQTKMVDMICATVDRLKSSIRQELLEDVDRRIESHRRSMWVKDKWCCKPMAQFAVEAWQSPNPPNRDSGFFGNVTLQLRNHTVNYCPFCGVKV